MVELYEHGTAHWQTFRQMKEAGIIDGEGLVFGYVAEHKKGHAITYAGDAHMVTKAPTRGGKGVCQIIPSLLDHKGGLLCIDVKGENAVITAEWREAYHGQQVEIFDPWNIACKILGRESSRFNPLDILNPDSPNFIDDVMEIADAIIMAEAGEDSHWSDEAKALCASLIEHLATSPKEEGKRNLGRLREILSLHPEDFQNLICDMAENGVESVRDGANRIMQKSEKELSAVISTAQRNTHFLEGRAVKDALSSSSFEFDKLKSNEGKLSVYIVIPSKRLKTHGRLLRLLVACGLTTVADDGSKPEKPTLFMLDEFAALGKMAAIEQAFGLMAGYGMQLHVIVQDFGQLNRLYGQSWQTFIANAGVVQVFGTNDLFSAEYMSKILGQGTHEIVSDETRHIRNRMFNADPDHKGTNDRIFGRSLMTPDEIMSMDKDMQILKMAGKKPIICEKIPYWWNGRYFKTDGNPIFRNHPNNPEPSKESAAVLDQATRERWALGDDDPYRNIKTAEQLEKEAEEKRVDEAKTNPSPFYPPEGCIYYFGMYYKEEFKPHIRELDKKIRPAINRKFWHNKDFASLWEWWKAYRLFRTVQKTHERGGMVNLFEYEPPA